MSATVNQTFTSTQEKPLLDESAFQQLLSAAYVLQSYNERMRVSPEKDAEGLQPAESSSDYAHVLAEIVETQNQIQTRQSDLSTAALLIAQRAQKISGAAGAAVGLMQGEEVSWVAAVGSASGEAGLHMRPELSLSLYCLRQGQLLQCGDGRKDSRVSAALCRERGVRSLISVPIFHDGKIAGVLELRFDKLNAFHEHDVRTCQLMAGLVTEALNRAAELEWKQVLAVERATMLEALERLKPQLERLAEEPPPSSRETPCPAADEQQRGWPGVSVREETPAFSEDLAEVSTIGQAIASPSPAEIAPTDFVHCLRCGNSLEAGESFCGTCGMPNPTTKPTGDIQSKWASMWHMQQAAVKRQAAVAGAAPHSSAAPAMDRAEPASPLHETGFKLSDEKTQTVSPATAVPEETLPVSPWTSAQRARQWLESVRPRRVRLVRFWQDHRAHVYLAVAALLLGLVLAGWSSSPSSVSASSGQSVPGHAIAPRLTPFEKTLIALGLAVPPPLVVPDYRGNPDARVWVDVHTALYYCTGADLYGKTPGGKYASQHDAQLDQFEPESRKACD